MPNEQSKLTARPLEGNDQELSNLIRDAAFGLTGAHESREHGGMSCAWNRIGLIAWMAHILGVSSVHLPQLTEAIAVYERDCPCGVPTLDDASFTREHRQEGEGDVRT